MGLLTIDQIDDYHLEDHTADKAGKVFAIIKIVFISFSENFCSPEDNSYRVGVFDDIETARKYTKSLTREIRRRHIEKREEQHDQCIATPEYFYLSEISN